MAAPPYQYGGGYTGYGYGGGYGPNQQAMRDQLAGQDYDPELYGYPAQGQIQGARTADTSRAGNLAGTAVDLAPTVATQIAGRAAGGAAPLILGSAGQQGATIGIPGGAGAAGGVINPALGAGAAAGLGLATELGSAYLKPKSDLPTASPFASITDKYGRREEGSGEGIAGGAVKWGGRGAQVGQLFGPVGLGIGAGVGALGGAIGGAFTKNAKSASTDFSRRDAVEAIKELYRTQAGRMPEAGEVERILLGGGTKPGDRWVGEKQLYSQLNNIAGNFAKERAGLPVPPGAGAVPPAENPNARVTTPEAAAGMNQNPQRVNAPSGVPPAAQGGGGVYGAPANTTLGASDYGGAGGQVNAPVDVTPPAGTPPAGTPPAATTPPAGTAPPATTPPVDQSKWDTDQYAKPAYTAPKPSTTAPLGFNQEKWANPNHQTPKYVVGRILSQFPPKTENVPAAVAEIQKAYPGARQVGNGKVNIPGVGTMDILVGANVGGKRWHAGTTKSRGGDDKGEGAGSSAANRAAGYDLGGGGDISGASNISGLLKQLQKASGGKGAPGIPSAYEALLANMRG